MVLEALGEADQELDREATAADQERAEGLDPDQDLARQVGMDRRWIPEQAADQAVRAGGLTQRRAFEAAVLRAAARARWRWKPA
jgi:hypothetical protein